MPQGRKKCPLCLSLLSSREILRHIRDKHSDVLHTQEQLRSVDAKQCTDCRKVVSTSGKEWHACQPSRSQPTHMAPETTLELRSGSLPLAPRAATGRDASTCDPVNVGTTRLQSNNSSVPVQKVVPTRRTFRIPLPCCSRQVPLEVDRCPIQTSLNCLFEPEHETTEQLLETASQRAPEAL